MWLRGRRSFINLSAHVTQPLRLEEVQHVRRLSLVGTRMRLADLERAHILSILEDHGGNRERASAVLGISARTLYRKLARVGFLGTTKVQLAAPGTVSAVGAKEEKTRILRKINKGA